MDKWLQRYGVPRPSGIPDELDAILSHRSVRRFAPDPIPECVIVGLVAAAQSAATSSNLQAWSVISIQNPESRARIAKLTGGQKQVKTAPLFFAFLADLHRVEAYGRSSGEPMDGLDTAEMYTVAVIDAALAAERMVCAAEALGYGICYIGALRNHPDQVKEALRLPEKVAPVFGLCIGTPADGVTEEVKPRLDQSQVWFRETYPDSLDSSDYDRRANEYFAAQGMSTDQVWSVKSAARVNLTGLSGREKLLAWLHGQGLLKR